MRTHGYLVLALGIIGCNAEEQEHASKPQRDTAQVAIAPNPNHIAPELPDRMRVALDQFAPGFERFAVADYTPDLVSNPPSDRPPYQATGDFNGDGLPDLGLFGRDKTRELVIALVSMPDSGYRVFQLKEWGRPPLYNHNINVWLSSVKPGKVDADYAEVVDSLRPSTLPHGAISVNYAEVNEVFYWNGSGFLAFATGGS